MKLAFLFPGQGAQAVGMGRALAEAHESAREVYETADRVLGFPLSRLMWKGPEAELRRTVHAQPALLTHSVAAWRLVESFGVRPAWVAGHSLGEYSACVAAGALSFVDALRLTHRRGELMERAGIERPGTMAAILGLSVLEIESVCAAAAAAGVVRAANMNAPGQVVISGEVAAVEMACEIARARGARRAIRLDVSGAFHSPLMEPAAQGLAEALEAVELRDGRCPIVANVSARPVQRAEDIRAALRAQLLGAVRWEDSMRFIEAQAVEGFIELGTGRVLRGLLRVIGATAPCWNVEEPASLMATLGAIGASSLPGVGST